MTVIVYIGWVDYVNVVRGGCIPEAKIVHATRGGGSGKVAPVE